MPVLTTEIIPGIFRISIAPTPHFEFNHFLCIGERTCLIHCGKRSVFDSIHAEVSRLLNGRGLDTIVFSHYEADECGSINAWLAAYPECTTVCNKTASISLNDEICRPAEVIQDRELIDLGGFDLQMIETPHFPHNWDAHLWFERCHGILFSSDFCIQGCVCPAKTDQDISQIIIDYYEAGKFMPYGSTTNAALEIISELPIQIIAPMHGSTIYGSAVSAVLKTVRRDLFLKSA